jgi:hypothetical protein
MGHFQAREGWIAGSGGRGGRTCGCRVGVWLLGGRGALGRWGRLLVGKGSEAVVVCLLVRVIVVVKGLVETLVVVRKSWKIRGAERLESFLVL